MIYRARLQRDSPTWREWHGRQLPQADLLGIVFHRVICLTANRPAVFDYETEDLSPVQVITLEQHEDVEIEMHGNVLTTKG